MSARPPSTVEFRIIFEMGVDFTAILDHKVDICDLIEIPQRLNEVNPLVAKFFSEEKGQVAGFPEKKEGWRYWPDPLYPTIQDEFKKVGHVDLDGPFGFGITLGCHILEIRHVTRWYRFLTNEDDVQSKLTKSCVEVGKILNSEEIIYLPDSLYEESRASDFVYEGGWMKDVKDWLTQNCGQPKPKIEDLLKETDDDSSDYSGYYVERS